MANVFMDSLLQWRRLSFLPPTSLPVPRQSSPSPLWSTQSKESLTRPGDTHKVAALCWLLTDLQLPSDASFALVPEVDLGLVVLGHHLHKLLGQDGVLREKGENVVTLFIHSVSVQWTLMTFLLSGLGDFWLVWMQVSFFRPARSGLSWCLRLFVQPGRESPMCKDEKCSLLM